MSQKSCSDVFGARVADRLYCIQLTLGNNSGYQLKVARVGFQLNAGGLPSTTITNNSYRSTRAILLKEEITNGRNIFYNVLQATGVLMAGFTPYFGTGKHPNGTVNNARTNWTTAASIVSGPLLAAFNIIAPNPVITQLNSLDDESLRDGQVIASNDQSPPVVVFVEKQSLNYQLNALPKIYPSLDLSDYSGKQPQDTDVPKKYTSLNTTIENSKDSRKAISKKSGFSPYLVELALGNMVIVGQPIQYLPRVQITAAPVTSALVATPYSLNFFRGANGVTSGVTSGTSQPITLPNNGTTPITGIKANIIGTNSSDFNIIQPANASDACPSSLAPSAKCTISVTFGPPATTAGAGASRSASVQISYDSGSASAPTLIGTASDTVYFSTTALSLGSATTTKPATATLTIINFNGSSIGVSVANPTGTNAAEFTYTANTCGTAAAPIVLAANQGTCSINVTLTPTAAGEGARAATMSVTYTISGTPQTQPVSLSGTGQ
jgi:hypothetical protein